MLKFLKILFPVFLCLLFVPDLSHAAHPLITDDTGTQGKGRFQFELNGEYSHDSEGDIKTNTVDIKAVISYGVNDNVDLILTLPYQRIKLKDNDERYDWKGLSDIGLEVKWCLYDKGGLSLALKPGLTLPSGDEDKGLGSGRMTGSLFFITTFEASPWAFHINVGYIRNENKIDERKDIWHVSMAGTIDTMENLKIVADLGMERNPEKGTNKAPAFILTGLIYSLNKDLDLDLGIKAGLNEAENDLTGLVGLTWRF